MGHADRNDRDGKVVITGAPGMREQYASEALEASVQRGVRPPDSGFVPKPESGDVVNNCSIESAR